MEIDLRINDSPWNRRVTLNTIARRNICRIIIDDEEHDIIISAIYADQDGVEWLQGVNVSDIIDRVDNPVLSNLIVKMNNIKLIEFKDTTVYDLNLNAEEASSIMRRTDKVVRLAKDGVALLQEAERVRNEPEEDKVSLRITP